MNSVVRMAPGTVQGNWVWDGTQWVCGDCDDIPPFPGCPPVGFPPPGCPPWFPSANSPPWYPGANAGVSFGLTPPQNPVRGHFWWNGMILQLFDGAMWVDTQGTPSPQSQDAPKDGNAYGRVNGAWARVVNGAGDTMTGLLLLSGDPAQPLGASTKQYTDAHSGIQHITTVFYTSSQTITIPSAATQAMVTMWGATGGSGGVGNSTSAGTAAGGYLEKFLTGLISGNTLIYTQGGAGVAGIAASIGSVTTGGNGGVTTLISGTQTIPPLTCNGSTGSAAFNGVPSTPGTATGGDVNLTGQFGIGQAVNQSPGGRNIYSIGAPGVENSGSVPGNQGNPGGLKVVWYAGGPP